MGIYIFYVLFVYFTVAMEQVLAESQAFNLMVENYLNTRGEAVRHYHQKYVHVKLRVRLHLALGPVPTDLFRLRLPKHQC